MLLVRSNPSSHLSVPKSLLAAACFEVLLAADYTAFVLISKVAFVVIQRQGAVQDKNGRVKAILDVARPFKQADCFQSASRA